ncbi:MAG: class F sortase [Minisyncoccia bacterium]|jgi:LPXTG-site transpeptidase (sortase) family protein
MKSKISLKWSLLIFGTIAIVLSSVIIFFLNFDLPIQGSYAKLALPASGQTSQNPIDVKPVGFIENTALIKQVDPELPIHLKIPKINVDAALEHVGLTPQGAVDVPHGPANAAWFDESPRPGEKGSSVIVGHYGWKDGIPAVFDNLNELERGDKLYVEDQRGMISTFVVRESRMYGESDDVSSVFGSSDGNAHLNLITCEGVWNKTQKTYSNRLVVFADKE